MTSSPVPAPRGPDAPTERATHDSRPTVLVTDASRGGAIAIIRSLGREGLRVVAADADAASLGFRSRYAHERLVYPDPERRASEFVECLERAARERGVDLIVPVTDEVIHPLSHARDRFDESTRMAIPDPSGLERTTDKARTVALAEELGVPIPETHVVRSTDEALDLAPGLRWPVVVKPSVSRRYDPVTGTVSKFTVSYAADSGELAERMESLRGADSVLLQSYCPGVGTGVEILAHDGHVVAAFQHRRLAEVPLSGGVSALRESVALDPDLFAHSARLVRALRWTGLIMVEFKVGTDARLMEINGRVWGSLPLAVKSGMDFPRSSRATLSRGAAGDAPHVGPAASRSARRAVLPRGDACVQSRAPTQVDRTRRDRSARRSVSFDSSATRGLGRSRRSGEPVAEAGPRRVGRLATFRRRCDSVLSGRSLARPSARSRGPVGRGPDRWAGCAPSLVSVARRSTPR